MVIKIILITVEVICSPALTGLILLQQSKSEGLGLAFGAGMGESLFGSRAGNILTKLTVIFTVIFMANTVLLAMSYTGAQSSSLMSRVGHPAPASGQLPMPAGQPEAPQQMPVRTAPASAPMPGDISPEEAQ